ncbi:hypothetical protein EDD15DRAFT_2198823 [Pisolithus albus]|nr:hypothetical protein EDD15DRAFT_2198823 [Pisolithus albus]
MPMHVEQHIPYVLPMYSYAVRYVAFRSSNTLSFVSRGMELYAWEIHRRILKSSFIVRATCIPTASFNNDTIWLLTRAPDPLEPPTDTSKRTKFRPSGTKNGRNLCILWWLKQVNANGQKEEFHVYYEKTLTATQREDYNNEAKQLISDIQVKDNGWVKAVIENGKVY